MISALDLIKQASTAYDSPCKTWGTEEEAWLYNKETKDTILIKVRKSNDQKHQAQPE